VDWTDKYNQKETAKKANQLIDDIIKELHQAGLAIYRDFSLWEFTFLVRFPLHVGVNLFIEKMMRQAHCPKKYPQVAGEQHHFKDTQEAVVVYYYDFYLNYKLLNDLADVFQSPDIAQTQATSLPRENKLVYKNKLTPGAIKWRITKFLANLRVRLEKPSIVGEYSKWMKEFLTKSQIFHFDFEGQSHKADAQIRQKIRACCERVFSSKIDGFLTSLTEKQKTLLVARLAEFVDYILPIAVVEGLAERHKHYQKLIRNWPIKQLHSFVGFVSNENCKLFGILAKRKGAVLVAQEHGAAIPHWVYKFVKNELVFVDYYIFWGKKNCNWLKGEEKLDNLKIVNAGSVFLNNIKKWKKRPINPTAFTVLYPSGPLLDFMTDIEDPTPEKSLQLRMQILTMLKQLLAKYPGMKVWYKPFPGTYTNDPIKKIMAKEIAENRVQLVKEKPAALYYQADIVLWDTISTGFAECVQSGVPTLVFHSQDEYKRAALLGQNIADDLKQGEIAFYSKEAGLKSFERILSDSAAFMAEGSEAIKRFKESVAYPVTGSEFKKEIRIIQ